MNLTLLTILLCSISSNSNCVERTSEYYQVANKYSFDPVLLIAIDIYECDLRDDIFVEYRDEDTGEFIARDMCPMGLRIYKKRKLSRLQIIDQATHVLSFFRDHTKNCLESHAYLNHYNSGFRHVRNNYGWQVNAIYHTLQRKQLTKYEINKLNPRTKQIIKDLNNDLYSASI